MLLVGNTSEKKGFYFVCVCGFDSCCLLRKGVNGCELRSTYFVFI